MPFTEIDSKNLARIADALESLASGPSGGVAQANAPRVREQVLSEHMEKWNGVKKRFPAFPIHPKSCEAYEKHLMAFGHEPSKDSLVHFDKQLTVGRAYSRNAIESEFLLPKDKAAAIMQFLKWSGLCIWSDKYKGICTLRKE